MSSPDPLAELRDLIAWVEIVKNESRRTILCQPHLTDTIQALLDRSPFGDLLTVRTAQFLPADTVVVMDEQAIEASSREAMQHRGPAVVYEPLFPADKPPWLRRWPWEDWKL